MLQMSFSQHKTVTCDVKVVFDLFLNLFLYLCVQIFYLHVCLCNMYVQCLWGTEEGESTSKMGLQMVVPCYMAAGD